ncbi:MULTISPECIES: hypothetical protein [Clostridium]|uniref:hypothetical protein n=1 Tax=Clostridium TaxID=1485 RepID=UPI0005C13A4D|nr:MULTISPECIES: hypothetical protein [Clostridium]KIU08354.1 hypothetical protein SC08_Contig83orf02333 [Clostridium butyricum]MBA8968192.1 hypothetical protein [Clostridium butyricum]MBA8970753.1 hypothetical protein [Clostridium butyricum]MBC2426424.1 lytic transglycosylase domain-containing protein [Clostridium butyricum]MDB2139879.1 hypothetical protein [Clostridium butyricum]
MFKGNRPVVLTAYCGTINALKKLGKDWKDISLNDIYKNATNSESREYAGRVLYAYKLLKESFTIKRHFDSDKKII